jgi:hypothetical protein
MLNINTLRLWGCTRHVVFLASFTVMPTFMVSLISLYSSFSPFFLICCYIRPWFGQGWLPFPFKVLRFGPRTNRHVAEPTWGLCMCFQLTYSVGLIAHVCINNIDTKCSMMIFNSRSLPTIRDGNWIIFDPLCLTEGACDVGAFDACHFFMPVSPGWFSEILPIA